ncbi:MAG: DUF402 domain-containing protein [Anaerolineae bacterium]|nr:DUF402 domain-containing protein [Anaerolineae bacterium]
MINVADPIKITKQKYGKNEPFSYMGKVLELDDDHLVIEAYFNRDDLPFHGLVFKRNDRFVETYYLKRWYNLFEIHDRDDDNLKCWYCNVAQPVELGEGEISFVDLALDVLVYADRSRIVLDEDEFEALNLPANLRQKALAALEELKKLEYIEWTA